MTAIEQQLRAWRRDEAVARGVPSYIVMTERLLRELVQQRPQTVEELRAIRGFGPKSMELYKDQLLALLDPQLTDEELDILRGMTYVAIGRVRANPTGFAKGNLEKLKTLFAKLNDMEA